MRKRFRWEPLGPLLPILIFVAFSALVIAAGYAVIWLLKVSWFFAVPLGSLLAVAYARFRHVSPTIPSMLANGAAALAYVWVFFWLDARWWWKAPLLLALSPLFILANKTHKIDVELGMRQRSERAAAVVQRVRANQPGVPRFALYLRPFSTTDRLVGQTGAPQFDGADKRTSHVDFETLLTRALSRECELIALGRPDDIAEGAARVTTSEEEWREVVRQLLDAAVFIVIVPFAEKGTLWELREIQLRGHLEKTVFVMPEIYREQPNGVVAPTENYQIWDAGVTVYDPSQHVLDVAAEWTHAKAALDPAGIHLPPYCGTGAMFTVSPENGQVARIAPIPLALLIRRLGYLRHVLSGLGVTPWRREPGADLLEALEVAAFPNIRTREYVLTLAIDLFVAFGDLVTASTVAERMNNVVRGRPRLLNAVIAGLPDQLAELAREGGDAEEVQRGENWLNAVAAVPGLDEVLVKQARTALETALKRSAQ